MSHHFLNYLRFSWSLYLSDNDTSQDLKTQKLEKNSNQGSIAKVKQLCQKSDKRWCQISSVIDCYTMVENHLKSLIAKKSTSAICNSCHFGAKIPKIQTFEKE